MRCTWKEAGFLAYNYQWAGLHDLFIIIYTSSTCYLLIILNLTYSLGDVEGGWILRPPIIHGRGCGALEQSPRYREGSMKVQIRKYGGGNYDGIGCGAQVSQVSMRKDPVTQAQFDLGPKLSLPSLSHLIPFKPKLTQYQPACAT